MLTHLAYKAGRLAAGAWKLRSREQLRKLEEHSSAGADIAWAIRTAHEGRTSSEEAAWAGRIEALRRELLESEETFEFTDFGAGSAAGKRSTRSRTMTVREACRASKSAKWALLLHKLVSRFQPENALEMGTNLGISASYQASALLTDRQRLLTLEGSEEKARIAQRSFDSLGIRNVEILTGRFSETLDRALEKLTPLAYAFVDGHHEEEATLKYFGRLSPALAPVSLLVFDDIHWNAGMGRAWRSIRLDPRVEIAVETWDFGICLLRERAGRHGYYVIY